MEENSSEILSVEILTPEGTIFSGKASMVVIPGAEGEFGVLAGHVPLVSSLSYGIARIYQGEEVKERIFISGGFAEVTSKEAIILADEATYISKINKEQTKEKIESLKQQLNNTDDNLEKLKIEEHIKAREAMLGAAK